MTIRKLATWAWDENLRFGHREGRNDLAGQERFQIAGLLVLGAEHGQDFSVAGIRRGGAEYGRRPIGAAEDLVHQGQLDLAIARSTKFRSKMAGPQALGLHLGLERLQNLAVLGVLDVIGRAVTREQKIQRLAFLAHEGLDPVQLFLEFRIG